MFPTDSPSTDPSDWTYVAEGGESLVIAYTGPPRPVLRLKKAKRQDILLPELVGPANLDRPHDDTFTVRYQHDVIERLLPITVLPRYSTVRLTPEWLASIDNAVTLKRPQNRVELDAISLKQSSGVLVTNLVAGTGVVVEVKPKWGFLPSPTHLSDETRDKKRSHCRLCMHTQYKRNRGETVAEAFCPLDLYSGDPARIRDALVRLWTTWVNSKDNAIHNLRIFFDGETADARDACSVDGITQWLTSHSSATTAEDAFIELVTERLANSKVLNVLSHLQRTLDPLDIEGLSKLASQTNQPLSSREEVTLDEWLAFTREHQDSARDYDHSNPDGANLKYYKLAYQLSASFKDCSIMINLDDALADNRVAIIDLDPKPAKKFAMWEALDRKIVTEYTPKDGERCVDSLAS